MDNEFNGDGEVQHVELRADVAAADVVALAGRRGKGGRREPRPCPKVGVLGDAVHCEQVQCLNIQHGA